MMQQRQWSVWQIVVLILVVIGGAVYVVSGWLGSEPGPSLTQSSPVSRAATSTRPVIYTNTPTPTSLPTATPGPTPTPTGTPTPTRTPSPTPTPTNTPIVVNPKLKALGRLETAQYVMQVVIDLEREPNSLWQQAFGTDKLLLVAEGEVVAGFDLAKIKPEDVVVDGRKVNVKLPASEILHHSVNEDKTYVYERQTGFLVPPDPSLETDARRRAEQEVLNWALEHDVYQKAEEFGVAYLDSFLRSLGFTEVTIEVQDVDQG
jgi:hypothetical protein